MLRPCSAIPQYWESFCLTRLRPIEILRIVSQIRGILGPDEFVDVKTAWDIMKSIVALLKDSNFTVILACSSQYDN